MRIINLLPKSKQREFQYEVTLHSLWAFCAVSAGSFALVFLALFGTRLYVQWQGAQIEQQTQQIKNFANKQENTQLRNQVKSINNVFGDFQNLADATPRWSKVLSAFTPLVPENVKISSFSADLKTKKVQILGYSPTREAVIDLYNNINKDSKDFFNIDYPLENVSKPENISFHYSFSIKDDLLK
jgi:Tfp pilus assembly protein PilN